MLNNNTQSVLNVLNIPAANIAGLTSSITGSISGVSGFPGAVTATDSISLPGQLSTVDQAVQATNFISRITTDRNIDGLINSSKAELNKLLVNLSLGGTLPNPQQGQQGQQQNTVSVTGFEKDLFDLDDFIFKIKEFQKKFEPHTKKISAESNRVSEKPEGVAKVKQGPKLETIELDALEIKKKSMPYQFEEIKSYMALKKTNNDDINFMIKNIKQEKLVESSTAFTNIQSTAIPTFTQNYNIPDLLQGTTTNSANIVAEFWSSPNDVKTCLKNTRYTNALSSILNMQNIESAFSTFDTIFKLNYISKFNELFSERDNPL